MPFRPGMGQLQGCHSVLGWGDSRARSSNVEVSLFTPRLTKQYKYIQTLQSSAAVGVTAVFGVWTVGWAGMPHYLQPKLCDLLKTFFFLPCVVL